MSIVCAQSPIGQWKKISHTVQFGAKKMDTHAALVLQRPCVDKIIYEINADGSFRLNASKSGCDASYSSMQEKLYSKTKWKLEGSTLTTSATDFALGQAYTISFSGNKITWTGKDDLGVIIYQKI